MGATRALTDGVNFQKFVWTMGQPEMDESGLYPVSVFKPFELLTPISFHPFRLLGVGELAVLNSQLCFAAALRVETHIQVGFPVHPRNAQRFGRRGLADEDATVLDPLAASPVIEPDIEEGSYRNGHGGGKIRIAYNG